MPSYYLNTDLCLVSMSNLTPLTDAVKGKTCLLHCCGHSTKWHASFETIGSGHPGKKKPTDDRLRLLRVLGNLKGPAAALWNNCCVVR